MSRPARSGAPQKKRWIDYPRRSRTGPRRWLPSLRQLLALFLLLLGGTAAAVGYAYATVTIPDPNPTALLQNNVYYWSDGTVLATDGSVNRQNVSLSQVPADVRWDFVAAENASFYTDPGIDPQGILRAVVHMAAGDSVQSGSTITQQFVKNTYLDQSQTVSRKFKELLISTKIGAGMTKEQILQRREGHRAAEGREDGQAAAGGALVLPVRRTSPPAAAPRRTPWPQPGADSRPVPPSSCRTRRRPPAASRWP
ncbi:transglycosylase domain-containing protein [Streptomyces avermitilis]|uniref:transglycosylase domain-containing protein n=1 Tax=Streptomyces avermitilis TaxID=33903 RepID=UPI003816408B